MSDFVAQSHEVTITPVLAVRDAEAAIAFYGRAFGAVEVTRTTGPEGTIVAELALAGARIRIADEAAAAGNPSPETLGGTPVRLNVLVSDPDEIVRRAVAAGATEVHPVADQAYGLRQGRIVDPFGHHWLIGRPLAGPEGDWARM